MAKLKQMMVMDSSNDLMKNEVVELLVKEKELKDKRRNQSEATTKVDKNL